MKKSEIRSISTLDELEAAISVNSLMAESMGRALKDSVTSGKALTAGNAALEGFRRSAFKSVLPYLFRFAIKAILRRRKI